MLGGTDANAYTVPIANFLLSWFPQASVVAVLGDAGAQAEALASLQRQYPSRLEVVVGTNRMAETMLGCTCAVGAPGGTLWERFCLGLPTACATTAATQRPVIEKLARAGWLLDLGEAASFARTASRAPVSINA